MNRLEKLMSDARLTVRRPGAPQTDGGCVVYFMQRAQRALDNPALDVAIAAANELQKPLAVFFGLRPDYPNANLRHYAFLLEGLPETAAGVEKRGAAFVFRPFPDHHLIAFCEEVKACLVIGDENPLREPERWRVKAAEQLRVPFWTVDADVVIPTKLFPKEEYAARTLRPKYQRLLEVFLHPSRPRRARYPFKRPPPSRAIDAPRLLAELPLDRRASPVNAARGGTGEALRQLRHFIKTRLARYDTARNLPHEDATSKLSAYLHFGQLSPLTVALAVKAALKEAMDAAGKDADKAVVQDVAALTAAADAYLEELLVRRELAMNFVARNAAYDRLEGAPDWGRKTLAAHADDPRPRLYSEAQLEAAETADPLWNAAQMEMVKSGRMHGYLRMYWAKKILEWTATPAEAFAIAVRLNDRYQLDGRDANGYTGIAWAIGGRHDRPWAPQKPVFGLLRPMSAAGMARKFDVAAYLERVRQL